MKIINEPFMKDFKEDVYSYHKDLHINDRGFGGSICKRVRERFSITYEQLNKIINEIERQSKNRNYK